MCPNHKNYVTKSVTIRSKSNLRPGKNYVECFLNDPLLVGDATKFGISLDTKDLTDTNPITLNTQVRHLTSH